jgi:hypothetical protein
VRQAFYASYTANRLANQFTKVEINYQADQELQMYFRRQIDKVESWFNVLAPHVSSIQELKLQLHHLVGREWFRA